MSGIKVVAVTGATGFIGSHVVHVLLERGYTVHACVRNKDDTKCNFLYDLEKSLGKGKLKLFSASLLDKTSYDQAFIGADAVIHCAAALIISNDQDPQKDMVDPSTEGTLNVLGSVEKAGVKHFVHTSSIAAVSNRTKGSAFDENDWSDAEIGGGGTSSYAYAKLMGEKFVWDCVKGKAYTVSCINPTMVFGRCLAKPHAKASPFVFRQALYGNDYANTPMSVVDVRDVAIAHVEAMERHNKGADRKRFIIDGDSDNMSTNDIIKQAAGLFPKYAFRLSSMRDPPHSGQHPMGYLKKAFNNTRSKDILGMQYISQEECIRSTVASMVDPGWVPARPANPTSKL